MRRCSLFVSVIGLALGTAISAANGASVLYSAASNGSGGSLYTVDQNNGAETVIGAIGFDWPGDLTSDTRAGSYTMYAPDIDTGQLLTVNPANGAGTAVGSFNTSTSIVSVAFDAITGRLYGTTAQGFGATNGDALYEINPATGNATFIGALGINNVYALAFDTTGVLYGVGYDRQALFTVSTITGAASLVAPVSLTACYDIAARPDDGVMFAVDSATNTLYTMNLTTGATIAVGPYGSLNMVGLAFSPVPEPATLGLMAAAGAFLARRRRSQAQA